MSYAHLAAMNSEYGVIVNIGVTNGIAIDLNENSNSRRKGGKSFNCLFNGNDFADLFSRENMRYCPEFPENSFL